MCYAFSLCIFFHIFFFISEASPSGFLKAAGLELGVQECNGKKQNFAYFFLLFLLIFRLDFPLKPN